jgi:vacuolar protein sorting-associated protein 54
MERLKHFQQTLEHEQWTPTDVPTDYQKMINSITSLSEFELHEERRDDQTLDDQDEQDNRKKISNVQSGLIVEKKNFKVAWCCLVVVDNFDKYLMIARRIPLLTPDVINRMVEFLKTYNQRIAELIVGGLVVQLNVLKGNVIKPTHLSLAAQSLGVFVALIPFFKKRLEQSLPQRQQMLLNDFDPVVEDLLSNQEKIYSRMVTIMDSLLKEKCSKISEVNWDDAPAKDSQQEASTFMVELVSNTKKLHHVIKKFLFPERVKTIFIEIFDIYNKFLEQQYSKIALYTSSGKSRLLIDVQFYISNLSSLEYTDGPGNSLEVVVNNIRIRELREKERDRKEKPLPAPSFTTTSGSSNASSGMPASNVAQSAASLASKANSFFSGLPNLGKPKVNQPH